MSKKLHLVSLGCTKNLVDSEVMLAKLKDLEITQDATEADVIIVNTCGFIDAAKEESINTILELHTLRKKNSQLVMAGCLSQRYKDELRDELKEVDLFTGVGDYDKIDELISQKTSRYTDQVFLYENQERVITGSNYHAYIKIAEGCNQSCSFCAIPSFKGKLHSRTLSTIIKEVQNLVNKGFFDFSFIAQDSSSYGKDIGMQDGLIELISEIEKISGIKRARILYLYPSTISKSLIEKISNSTVFAPYFDIPLQHASDNMLKLMKRGIGKAKTMEIIDQIKRTPNSYLRTAFIIGHPNETDEDFEELLALIKSNIFDNISVFAFSDEENTIANQMSNKIDPKVIAKRVKIVEKEINKNRKKWLANLVGKRVRAVIDSISADHDYLLNAKILDFAPEIDPNILINDSEIENLQAGTIGTVLITELAGDQLVGTFINDL